MTICQELLLILTYQYLFFEIYRNLKFFVLLFLTYLIRHRVLLLDRRTIFTNIQKPVQNFTIKSNYFLVYSVIFHIKLSGQIYHQKLFHSWKWHSLVNQCYVAWSSYQSSKIHIGCVMSRDWNRFSEIRVFSVYSKSNSIDHLSNEELLI